jgi:hypothetical protein
MDLQVETWMDQYMTKSTERVRQWRERRKAGIRGLVLVPMTIHQAKALRSLGFLKLPASRKQVGLAVQALLEDVAQQGLREIK